MGEGHSIINLGELSKPATVLIEKVSDAIGWVAEPYQKTRLAKADVEADKIRALGKINVSEIEQRAMNRMIAEETIKQKNIESITARAVKGLKDDAKPENLERDWVANFFDKCRLVSDEEMQSLWSRLLAEEANKSGTFSKRTVELVASLDKKDAHLFTKLIGFGWQIGNAAPLIYDFENEIYNKKGINFESLHHLDSIGLINFNSTVGFATEYASESLIIGYYSTFVWLNSPDKNIELGKVILTQAGQELASVCGAKSHPNFLEYILKEWDKLGYTYTCK